MADIPQPDPQAVIDEARPMIEAFLQEIGVYEPGQPLATPAVLEGFSDWVAQQPMQESLFWHRASRVAAFMCEYLIEGFSAVRYVKEGRIFLRVPVDAQKGTFREFDPYEVSVHLVNERKNLKQLMDAVVAR